MIISHKYKFIFVKTRKTAGSSTQMYLSRLCSKEDIFTPMDRAEQFYVPRNCRGLYNPLSVINKGSKRKGIFKQLWWFFTLKKFRSHISAQEIQALVTDRTWNEYYKFAIERNPWDKVLSHYHYSRQRFKKYSNMSLDDFISYDELPYNYHMYTDQNGKLMLDRIIHYENLIEELEEVFNLLGIPFEGDLNANEKSHYRTDKKSYKDIYNEEQVNKIGLLFDNEILMHSYKF